MNSSKKVSKLTFAFFLIISLYVRAQDILSPFPQEAEESLLSITLNDTDVELFVRGSWLAELQHNGILQWSPFIYSMNPLLFKQVPDLYIFLAIEQSYWFEAQIGSDAESNKFAAGYIHAYDDILVSIRLGNNGISMQSYPYLGIGNPASSFGIKADLFDMNSGSRTELLVRWDSVKEETALFYGTTEVASAACIPLPGYAARPSDCRRVRCSTVCLSTRIRVPVVYSRTRILLATNRESSFLIIPLQARFVSCTHTTGFLKKR